MLGLKLNHVSKRGHSSPTSNRLRLCSSLPFCLCFLPLSSFFVPFDVWTVYHCKCLVNCTILVQARIMRDAVCFVFACYWSNTLISFRVIYLTLGHSWICPIACKKWTSIHKVDERLTAISREVSKPWDSGLAFSNRSDIVSVVPLTHKWAVIRKLLPSHDVIMKYGQNSHDNQKKLMI